MAISNTLAKWWTYYVGGLGTAGQVLTSNGASTAPSWQAGGAGGSVIVRDIDGTPTVTATTIECTNGTVTDMGGGVARIAIGAGGGLDYSLAAAMHHLGAV